MRREKKNRTVLIVDIILFAAWLVFGVVVLISGEINRITYTTVWMVAIFQYALKIGEDIYGGQSNE